jgi:uncharacterized membrane protein
MLPECCWGPGWSFAGISHLTVARKEFQAQVPDWVPLDKDDTVVSSGVAEIASYFPQCLCLHGY